MEQEEKKVDTTGVPPKTTPEKPNKKTEVEHPNESPKRNAFPDPDIHSDPGNPIHQDQPEPPEIFG